MKKRIFIIFRVLTLAFLLGAASQSANALLMYSFSQNGFNGGGTVTGVFSGTDLDSNGQLSSFSAEISAFSMTFSGDSIVSGFSLSFADLFGLVYDIGSGFIGDGLTLDIEGVKSNVGGGVGFYYASGPGPLLGQPGGEVIDIATGATSSTQNMVVVTAAVPEPATLALVGLGLAGFGFSRRRKA